MHSTLGQAVRTAVIVGTVIPATLASQETISLFNGNDLTGEGPCTVETAHSLVRSLGSYLVRPPAIRTYRRGAARV